MLSKIIRKLMKPPVDPEPSTIQLKLVLLETTTRCNLRCFQCNEPEFDDLSWDNFQKLLPLFRKYQPVVQLNGHGETLLHPRFMDMFRAVRDTGCEVTFQTNAMLLTPAIIEECVQRGVERIITSVDAADPELFARIRPPARLETILNNFRLIQEAKRRHGTHKPQLQFSFVAMRQNIHELPKVIRLAADMGIGAVGVLELIEYDNTRQHHSSAGESLVNDPLMAEWADKAELLGKELGVAIGLPPRIPGRMVAGRPDGSDINPDDPETYRGLRKACRWPWENILVKATGKIQPCCMIKTSYGNIFEQSFEEIWSRSQYQKLRKKLQTDNPPHECLLCYSFGWEPLHK